MCASSRGDKKTGTCTQLYIHIDSIEYTCAYIEVFVLFLRMDASDNVDINLVKCGAYEVVKLSRQGVTMNENPAYGEIGVRIHSVLS